MTPAAMLFRTGNICKWNRLLSWGIQRGIAIPPSDAANRIKMLAIFKFSPKFILDYNKLVDKEKCSIKLWIEWNILSARWIEGYHSFYFVVEECKGVLLFAEVFQCSWRNSTFIFNWFSVNAARLYWLTVCQQKHILIEAL